MPSVTDIRFPDIAISEASLETERVIRVAFTDGSQASFAVAELPYSTGTTATEVRVIADGDAIEVIAPTGDFEVIADELQSIAAHGGLDNPALAEQIGSAIRRLRQARGLILRDVEALTGIAVPNLSTLEAGRALPRLDTLARVARALNTSVADLVASAQEPPSSPAFWPTADPGQAAPTLRLYRSPYKFRFYSQQREEEHQQRLAKAAELFPERGDRNELYLWLDEAFDAVDDLTSLWAEVLTSLDEDVAKDEQLLEAMGNLARRVAETARVLQDREKYRLEER